MTKPPATSRYHYMRESQTVTGPGLSEPVGSLDPLIAREICRWLDEAFRAGWTALRRPGRPRTVPRRERAPEPAGRREARERSINELRLRLARTSMLAISAAGHPLTYERLWSGIRGSRPRLLSVLQELVTEGLLLVAYQGARRAGYDLSDEGRALLPTLAGTTNPSDA
jgi:hypothetical protein